MINTISIKGQQLKKGFFQTGTGEKKVLIVGSCRVAPYVDYFDKLNTDNQFTIYSIDPFNWNWDENNDRVDYGQALTRMETHEGLLKMLSSIDIFIHEWYNNAEMFNCDKSAEKNIYKFGLSPTTDICIPNFNDYFILFADILNFDTEIRKKAIQDINVTGKISDQTTDTMYQISQNAYDKFNSVCRKSDLPEMEEYFKENFKRLRLHHNFNHVTKHFTIAIFDMICNRLNINITDDLWNEISSYDMFDAVFTPLTDMDIKYYGYEWNENVKQLSDIIRSR